MYICSLKVFEDLFMAQVNLLLIEYELEYKSCYRFKNPLWKFSKTDETKQPSLNYLLRLEYERLLSSYRKDSISTPTYSTKYLRYNEIY